MLRSLHLVLFDVVSCFLVPQNLLYETEDPDSELLVTDFGLARVYEGAQGTAPVSASPPKMKARMVGTVGYMAPEVITHRVYSPAADMFSAGVVLYTLLVGYPPFGGRTDREVLENTVAGRYGMPERRGWGEVSEDAKALVRGLLEADPEKRLTARQALADSWLQRGRAHVNDKENSTELGAVKEETPSMLVGMHSATDGTDGGDASLDAALAATTPPPTGGGSPSPPPCAVGSNSEGLGPSTPPEAMLPVLRGSQDRMREFNDQRTTLRLSRAAEFVLGQAAVHGSGVDGGQDGGGGGAAASVGAGLAALSGGDSAVINFQSPAVKKRVERAFRLLSPFNGGKLSPSRFALLARVVKAGHWPSAPLFAFSDRDRDGFVSTDDFFEAQALIRTRDKEFLYLLFQAYLDAGGDPVTDTSYCGGSGGGRQSSGSADPLAGSAGDLLFNSSKAATLKAKQQEGSASPGRKGSSGDETEACVRIKHVRAMFRARGVPGGDEAADHVFTAALVATRSATTDSHWKGPAAAAGAKPSQLEWEQLMGDLLPSGKSTTQDLLLDPLPPPSSSMAKLVGTMDRLSFPDFCVSCACCPVLVEVMLAETKSQAMTTLVTQSTTEGAAMTVVNSVIQEEHEEEERRKSQLA